MVYLYGGRAQIIPLTSHDDVHSYSLDCHSFELCLTMQEHAGTWRFSIIAYWGPYLVPSTLRVSTLAHFPSFRMLSSLVMASPHLPVAFTRHCLQVPDPKPYSPPSVDRI